MPEMLEASAASNHDDDDFKVDGVGVSDRNDQDADEDANGNKEEDDIKEEASKDGLSSNPQQVEEDCLNGMFNNKRRFVVRLRGLPWSAREKAIEEFFGPSANIKEIQIVYLTDGRVSGRNIAPHYFG